MRLIARNRALAALVSLGYLLGYLLVFVHFVAEQHAACSVHGGSHHVEHVDRDGSTPVDSGIERAPRMLDDHCHLLDTVRTHVAALSRTNAAFHTIAEPLIQPGRAAEHVDLRSTVWRYAPKQSPPAAS